METWLIPCNPDVYDAEGAFDEYGSIVWHQDCNIHAGDYVYIYFTAPEKEIRCKCIAEDVDIPIDIGEDSGYTLDEEFCSKSYRKYMRLRVLALYKCPLLGFQSLLLNGLRGTVRSQRRLPECLSSYIDQIEPLKAYT